MTEIRFPEYGPDYRTYLEESDLKSNTVSKRKGCVNEFIEYTENNDLVIETEDFYAAVDKLRSYFKDEEINTHGTKVSSIRDFLEFIATQEDSKTEDQLEDIREKISLANLEGSQQDVGKIDKKKIEEKLLKDEEIEAAKREGSDKAELVINLLMDTAARPGELAAMTPEDVDFENGSFHINSTWSDAEGFVQKSPKHDSFRKVKISDDSLEMLEQYIEENGFEDEDYLFDYTKDIYRPVKEAYTLAQVRLEDGKTNVTPHWHRHNACTRLIQNGNRKEKVQEYLGHGSIQITEHYEHFDDTQVVDVELA